MCDNEDDAPQRILLKFQLSPQLSLDSQPWLTIITVDGNNLATFDK